MILTNSVSGGGAEISMGRLHQTLTDLGVNTTLCAINTEIDKSPTQPEIFVVGREWKSGIKGTLLSLLVFRKHLLLQKPDLVIANCELPELYIAITAPWRLPIVSVEHTSRPWLGRKFLGVAVRFVLHLRRTRWVTVSRGQTKIWPFASMPEYIPNTHLQSSNKEGESKADLVFIGRLNQGKHPEIAAEAAKLTSATIDFFGTGPELENLNLKYRSSNICFRGFIEEPWTHISSRPIVIVPSEFEGDGMTVIESLSNGNPILLADNPDLRRFDLPDINYFENLEDLIVKIKEAQTFGVDKFRINEMQKESRLLERDPVIVGKKWISLFNKIGK